MDIGLELNLAKSDLDALQDRHRENVDKCFTEMLDLWLRTDPRPTLADLIAALKEKTVGFHQLAEDLEREGLKEDITVIELPSTAKRHGYIFDSPSLDNHPTYNTRELCLLHSNENMAKFGSSKKKCNSTKTGGSVFLAIIILTELYFITCAYIYTHVLPKDYSHYAIGRGLEVAEIRERTSVILYTVDQ